MLILLRINVHSELHKTTRTLLNNKNINIISLNYGLQYVLRF